MISSGLAGGDVKVPNLITPTNNFSHVFGYGIGGQDLVFLKFPFAGGLSDADSTKVRTATQE